MSRLRTTRAFTLIELIVVVIIIGILAAIASVSYSQFTGHARDAAVTASATDIKTAVDAAAATAGTSTAAVLAAAAYTDGTLTLPNGAKSTVAGGVLVPTGVGSFTITDGNSCSRVTGSTESGAVSTVSACDATPPADTPVAGSIPILGITGGYAVPVGTTGYTLTIPGLAPNTPYEAGLSTMENTSWQPRLTATTSGAGVGTFAVTFPTPEPGAALVNVAVTAQSSATNFPGTDVTFGATSDTTPVAITGLAGATIAGDGTTGYAMAVPGLTPNTAYTVADTGGMSQFYGATATSNGAGLVTFAISSTQWGAEPGATLNLASSSAATGTNASGTFTGLGVAPAPGPGGPWNLVLSGATVGQTYYAPGYLASAVASISGPGNLTFPGVYTGVDPNTDADAAWTGYMAGSPQDACANLQVTYPELVACSWFQGF